MVGVRRSRSAGIVAARASEPLRYERLEILVLVQTVTTSEHEGQCAISPRAELRGVIWKTSPHGHWYVNVPRSSRHSMSSRSTSSYEPPMAARGPGRPRARVRARGADGLSQLVSTTRVVNTSNLLPERPRRARSAARCRRLTGKSTVRGPAAGQTTTPSASPRRLRACPRASRSPGAVAEGERRPRPGPARAPGIGHTPARRHRPEPFGDYFFNDPRAAFSCARLAHRATCGRERRAARRGVVRWRPRVTTRVAPRARPAGAVPAAAGGASRRRGARVRGVGDERRHHPEDVPRRLRRALRPARPRRTR